MNSFNENLNIKYNSISLDELISIHYLCDEDFIPKLSTRVNIENYCKKLFNKADIISLHLNEKLIGILAIYNNDFINKTAFISSVCIPREYRGQGFGKVLLLKAIEIAKEKKFMNIKLEVGKKNLPALKLYKDFGFKEVEKLSETIVMQYGIK